VISSQPSSPLEPEKIARYEELSVERVTLRLPTPPRRGREIIAQVG
jgi:hypothetical protein